MFEVAATAYDRFMGVHSAKLAPQLADLAGVRAGQRVLDVGCGPGVLTAELVARVGPESVSAVDPSESFVATARERQPDVDVQRAAAEQLPFPDDAFDAALAQLVVHFMADPVGGLREMVRVTRDGGSVAACVWDHAGDRTPLTIFWQAARSLNPNVQDESGRAGSRAGHLTELFEAAGARDVRETALESAATFETFEDWWEPFTFGVGPVGEYARALGDDQRAALRERCRELLPAPPFTVRSFAWAARGLA